MEILVVSGYIISLLFIFLFSLAQLNLAWHYRKSKRGSRQGPLIESGDLKNLPRVTVQLPIYNELYVAERLIKTVSKFDYPREKLEIQVLDDSTDETVEIVAKWVAYGQQKGLDIQHIRRTDRAGYKAGALQHGLELAKGDLVAIFDADFMPQPDFLKKTVAYFQDPEIGVVQTRWGHLNQDYSILTRVQAFGLDAHFSVEQSGRSQAGSFINFNGTAGVWRKKCIVDAGGWSADTLTEDLDLSYRAQLKGWKFKYLQDVVSPAELPVIMSAIKSQQYRWNKGAAETAKKNLWKVLCSNLALGNKIHAFFHLFNSSVFIGLFIAAVLSIPMLFIKFSNPQYSFYFNLGSMFLIGFYSIGYFYWVSSKAIVPQNTLVYYAKYFPVFLTVSMGLSLHNACAVSEGILGFKTPFIRTPKFNVMSKTDSYRGNVYLNPGISLLTILEGLFSLYFLFGIITGIILHDYGLMVFHIMLTAGFAGVFYHSIRAGRHA
ncbi:MAG: glycosyltransferase family 2 protein [Bacteroidetes bacterium]|nr:glycosyltransferase family 2 protein [Bacteroidota bacterium]